MRESGPDVSVIVVSWNTRDLLMRCVESVRIQAGTSSEILVVDNASSDGSAEAAGSVSGVRVFNTGANLGFARGANYGARYAGGRFLLFLNPDAVLRPGSIAPLVRHAEANPDHALLGGVCMMSSGVPDRSTARRLPTLWSMFCYATGLNTLGKGTRLLDPEPMNSWDRTTMRTVEMLSGAFLLVRRDVFELLGGFDERYFMFAEDADLCARAGAAGFSCVLIPQAIAEHDSGQSSTGTAKMRLVLTGKATYLRHHWRGTRKRLGLVSLVTGVALRRLLMPVMGESTVKWSEVWHDRRSWIAGYPTPGSRADD